MLDNSSAIKDISDKQARILSLISELIQRKDKPETTWDRLARRVTGIIGSWKFLLAQTVLVVAWISYNISVKPVDPYPFILLNLLISMQSATLLPVIMMGQNLADKADRERAEEAYHSIEQIEGMMREIKNGVESIHEGYHGDD